MVHQLPRRFAGNLVEHERRYPFAAYADGNSGQRVDQTEPRLHPGAVSAVTQWGTTTVAADLPFGGRRERRQMRIEIFR
jgi:hypothetical protein